MLRPLLVLSLCMVGCAAAPPPGPRVVEHVVYVDGYRPPPPPAPAARWRHGRPYSQGYACGNCGHPVEAPPAARHRHPPERAVGSNDKHGEHQGHDQGHHGDGKQGEDTGHAEQHGRPDHHGHAEKHGHAQDPLIADSPGPAAHHEHSDDTGRLDAQDEARAKGRAPRGRRRM